jgi:carbamoyl-phosphate synthase large subunit
MSKSNKKINILFVGGGKRVSAAEGFINAGLELNLEIKIFAYENSENLPIQSIAHIIMGLSFNDNNIFNDIRKVIKENNINIIIPYHDSAVELLSQIKNEIFIPVSSNELCKIFNSKIKTNTYFKQNGLPIAGFDGLVPAIAKPDYGSSSKGLLYFFDQKDLTFFMKSNESSAYEVQNYIKGQEYSVDGYLCINSENSFFAVRKRLEVLGGEAVKSLTVNHPKILNVCKNLSKEIGFKGAVTIQFIEDENTKEIFLMEVNPRFGGAMLTTWGAGVPWFKIVLSDYLNLSFPEFTFKPNMLMVRSFREHFFQTNIHE